MRFNHMELTVPTGVLGQHRGEIAHFYTELFGWEALDVPILKQLGLLLRSDPETSQFLLVTESATPLVSPGYDHLGLLYESRAEVDALGEQCFKAAAKDPRVRVKEYEDLVQGPVTVHAFYVRFLLPIWFDVQCLEYAEGALPAERWRYGA